MLDITIALAHYGSAFATRDRARTIGREVAERVTSDDARIVLDLTGVRVISYSFADQLLTEVLSVLRTFPHLKQASVVGCSEDAIDVLSGVLKRRNQLAHGDIRPRIERDSVAISGGTSR